MPSVEAQLEADTLIAWVDQAPVIDGAELYDQLRESWAMARQSYQDARARGLRGQLDADKAVAEMADLVALLDVVAEALAYRRGLYLDRNQAWPLGQFGKYRIEMDWEHAER